MQANRNHNSRYMRSTLIVAIVLSMLSLRSFAQDTTRYSRLPFKNSAARVLKLKETNIAPVPAYRYAPLGQVKTGNRPAGRAATAVTISSASPNPVEGVLKLVLHTDKACVCMIKIVDILGNDVVNFGYERLPVGDAAKTYNMPGKITPGIYFVKVLTGSESALKRISVL